VVVFDRILIIEKDLIRKQIMQAILHKYSVEYTTVCRRIPICIQSEALVACHVAYERNKIAIFVTQKLKICALAQDPSQWVLIYMLFTFSDLPITVEVEPVDGRRIRTDWRKGTKCPPARNVSCGDRGEKKNLQRTQVPNQNDLGSNPEAWCPVK
jgi:hypothetical protein